MEMARMFKEMSGSDSLMKNITEAYSSAHGIGMRSLEMMNQMMMQQQGSPAWELIGNAMEGAKETLNNFVSSRGKADAAKARAEQAMAQERAMAHQAAAATAQAEAMARQAANDPTYQQAAAEAAAAAERAKAEHAEAINEVQSAVDEAQSAAEKKEEREAEMFGPVWPQVQQLRMYVAQEGAIEPVGDIVALGVVTAAIQIKAQDINVPAFALLNDGRTADLVEHLVPDTPGEFVGYCAKQIEVYAERVQQAEDPMDELQAIQAEIEGDDADEDEDE
jgi:hypothetical protein